MCKTVARSNLSVCQNLQARLSQTGNSCFYCSAQNLHTHKSEPDETMYPRDCSKITEFIDLGAKKNFQ